MKKWTFVLLCFLALVWITSQSTALDLSGAVVSPQYSFPDPDVQDVEDRFIAVHNSTELFYNSDGTWYAVPSTTIWSARAAFGYMKAYRATNDTLYATRAKEALQHLLDSQDANGFWDDSGFETGLSGAAMIEGYKIFGDQRYFQSSRDAADAELTLAYGNCTGELSYCAVMLWHLGGQYEITGQAQYLEKAISMAQYVIDFQDQNVGNWPADHSGDFSYHTFYSRGLTDLVRITPTDHQFEAQLIESTVRALNHTIVMQAQNGNFYQDIAQNFEATISSGTHPRAAHMLHIFINELGLTKIEDLMDGLTLYIASLDLGTMGEDERMMSLYATGVMLESYGGTIINLYFDPSMVTTTTTTTTTLPGDNGDGEEPPGGEEPPNIVDENVTTTTTTTPTTTQATIQTTTTTQSSGISQIIEDTGKLANGIITQHPLLLVGIAVLIVIAFILFRWYKEKSNIL